MQPRPPRYLAVPIVPFSIDLLLCQWVTLPDWHFKLCDPFWRIYWMAQKGWSIRFKEKSLPLEPGQLAVIPPDTPCRSESSGSATQFYIHFTLGSIINPYKPGVYFLSMTKRASSLIRSLMNPSRPENALAQTFVLKQLCYDTLSRLPAENLNTGSHSLKITTAMETMAQSLRNPFSNRELAKNSSMNTNAFIRLFHQETGQSPQKWYAEKRINQAALLLSHSTKTIEEISDETAFFDRSHFSRVFKQFKGMGPAAYRKQSRSRIS
jgi:AraC-like DNA-binding protein